MKRLSPHLAPSRLPCWVLPIRDQNPFEGNLVQALHILSADRAERTAEKPGGALPAGHRYFTGPLDSAAW
jgi:hypothetical protein